MLRFGVLPAVFLTAGHLCVHLFRIMFVLSCTLSCHFTTRSYKFHCPYPDQPAYNPISWLIAVVNQHLFSWLITVLSDELSHKLPHNQLRLRVESDTRSPLGIRPSAFSSTVSPCQIMQNTFSALQLQLVLFKLLAFQLRVLGLLLFPNLLSF